MKIEDFSKYWENAKCYSLIYSNDHDLPSIMFSKLRSFVILEINDGAIIKEILKRMKENGCEIFISNKAYWEKYPPISAAERMTIELGDCEGIVLS